MEGVKGEIWFENNIIYTPNFEGEPDPRGIGCVYFDCMSKSRDRLAQIDGLTGEEDTYGSLLQRCVRTSIALKEMGLKYGDIISSCTYNHLNSCVPNISGFFIGAKIAALDPSLSVSEACHLFRQVMPKVMFTGVESVRLIENVIKEVGADTKIVVFGPTDTHTPFSDMIQPQTGESSFRPVEVRNIRDIAVIMFSSGTTGLPKGICHTHYSILSMPGDLIIMLGVTYALTLCQTPKPESLDVSNLRHIILTGSPLTEDQLDVIKTTFPGVLVSQKYGQSEVFSYLTSFDVANPKHLELMNRKESSCGLPTRGTYYKVVDPDSEELLGANEKGELRVKSEAQLCGYYNMDSSGIWDTDGWLKTGDYGYYDEDFCFYITDRVKEMFRYRYKHITPTLIESVLRSHPSIMQAVVIGIPHYLDNYHPMAVVILNADTINTTAEEIEKYVEERVEDPLRLRAGVKFVKSFPLTPSRKVHRLKLKNLILSNQI
ncbi:hypothetical protein RI129_010740 [Pyrocoelia pectoralis]|uniref:Luciferin 4-monooxygenase n=1 Tax=Pyrocoelia pectoralis TaxID=417401 RepID=A0AAN7V9U6_9COLE